jgi:hypothetical protein
MVIPRSQRETCRSLRGVRRSGITAVRSMNFSVQLRPQLADGLCGLGGKPAKSLGEFDGLPGAEDDQPQDEKK